jgi:alpha-glucosidase/alpha-D-xyloside xylohydrolase
VYPGANGSFSVYNDDGNTYAYEKNGGSITKLIWDDAAHRLRHEGAAASSTLDKATVVVIRH